MEHSQLCQVCNLTLVIRKFATSIAVKNSMLHGVKLQT